MRRMVDQTGLNERLDQHSRRSGMMVGVSMALVVALTIGAFTWIFFRIDPYFSDFTGRAGIERASPVGNRVVVSPRTGGAATPGTATAPTAVAGFLAPPTPTALNLTAVRASATAAFVATHVIADFGQRVNLRAGPDTASAIVATLPPGTKLKFLDEEQRTGDAVWMRFQNERGDSGWIRQVDITPIR